MLAPIRRQALSERLGPDVTHADATFRQRVGKASHRHQDQVQLLAMEALGREGSPALDDQDLLGALEYRIVERELISEHPCGAVFWLGRCLAHINSVDPRAGASGPWTLRDATPRRGGAVADLKAPPTDDAGRVRQGYS
jgi:hypothetical protein